MVEETGQFLAVAIDGFLLLQFHGRFEAVEQAYTALMRKIAESGKQPPFFTPEVYAAAAGEELAMVPT